MNSSGLGHEYRLVDSLKNAQRVPFYPFNEREISEDIMILGPIGLFLCEERMRGGLGLLQASRAVGVLYAEARAGYDRGSH